MPGNNYIVYNNLRPPVCIDTSDGSPLRGKKPKKTMKITEMNNVVDQSGIRITKEMIVKQLTDDGHLVDKKWNQRHAVHPTAFNDKNSVYYKVISFTNHFVLSIFF